MRIVIYPREKESKYGYDYQQQLRCTDLRAD